MNPFQKLLLVVVLLTALSLCLGSVAGLAGIGLTALIVLGLGVALPRWQFFGPFICHGPATRHWVALTFDDGPDPRSTPALLDLLRGAKVEAAFFAVGRHVAARPELAARMVREGHLVENHSFHHSPATNCYSRARLQAELSLAQAKIAGATGVAPTLFRPPMGLSNPNVFGAARALGLQVIGWTARGWDTQVQDPERVVRRIVRHLKPGAIILLHDGNIPAERLVVTVKLLLARLQERGYEVVRLDRMLTCKV